MTHAHEDPSHSLSERAALELEADGAWLRTLASALTRDPARAAEAAQVTWMRSWRVRQRGRPASRSWLRTVLINALRREASDDARREARHERSVRPERASDELDTLERIELQRTVLDAVRNLDEPYRTTVVRRFLDDESVATIAARQGVPRKTVHTRISRALAALRADLDRRSQGGSSYWLGALALIEPDARPPLLLIGATSMELGTRTLVSAALVLIGIGGYFGFRDRQAPPTGVSRAVLAPEDGLEEISQPLAAHTPDREERQAIDVTDEPNREATEVQAEPSSPRAGRVLDLEGEPVAHVKLGLWTGTTAEGRRAPVVTTASDAAGRFRIDATSGGWLDIADEAWTALFTPRLEASGGGGRDAGDELRLIAMPAAELSGLVIDRDGRPIAGGEVRCEIDMKIYLSSTTGHQRERVTGWSTTTDHEGGYRLQRLPAIRAARLIASAPGYDAVELAVPASTDEAFDIVLERSKPRPRSLEGRVVDAHGAPIHGAWVTTGGVAGRSGPDGRFVVRINALPSETSIVVRAVVEGLLPAVRTITLPAPDPVELILDGAPLSIEGTVVDAEGRPARGAHVWVEGTEGFGSLERSISGVTYLVSTTFEELMQPEGEEWRSKEVESTTGAFEVHGLRDSTYGVCAIDPATLRSVSVASVRAGARGLTLQLPGSGPARPLSGRIVNVEGEPLAGVIVRASLSRSHGAQRLQVPPTTKTDEQGAFLFPDVAAERVTLSLADPRHRVDDERLVLESYGDRDDLVFELRRTVRARFEVEDPRFEDGILQLFDASGEWVPVKLRHGSHEIKSDRTLLAKGRTGVVSFLDAAVTVVVSSETEELRMPLDLSGVGELTIRVR
ncbi:MAG: sigma-70 family RNA polymerase sigma factor [bacterium]|nr:sigma-70 family RNA polymerase sigma factor [bacterium]